MATRLYLDTARLGLMSPSAQQISREYAGLIASEGCSPFFEQFLWYGGDTWSARLRQRFPTLAGWHGVEGLKSGIRRLAGFADDAPVFVAGRSCEVFRIAARFLCQSCEQVLTTASEWPGYLSILQQEASKTHTKLVEVADSENSDVTATLVQAWNERPCDGLFVSGINHLGRRIRLSQLLATLNSSPRCIVVDGAQHFCHVPEETVRNIDFYIAGGHKWLRCGLPMGIGIAGRKSTAESIQSFVHEHVRSRATDDPLLNLIECHALSQQKCCGETVNVAPLLHCHAAMIDASEFFLNGRQQFARRLTNGQELQEALKQSGWNAANDLDSGIVVLHPTDEDVSRSPPTTIRCAFQERGIAVSAFAGGLVRLSMPVEKLTGKQVQRIAKTCHRLA